MKKFITVYLLILSFISTSATNNTREFAEKANLHVVERKILTLSRSLDIQMMALSEYKNLKIFCSDDSYRNSVFSLLDEIHDYHDMLEADLQTTTYNHSKRTIKRIMDHMDNLDDRFNQEDFTGFFREQCQFQSKIEKSSDHYNAGFATHSYGGKVYAQEVVMYRYLKRLTKKVKRIRKHVEHFYIRRKVWEYEGKITTEIDKTTTIGI